jgi:hypothetical protein
MYITKNDHIDVALNQLDSQSTLNYAVVARDNHIHLMTLARRYNSKSVSQAKVNSKYRQRLNDM